MKPHNFHAPGMPNKLPDQPVVLDKQGNYVSGGKTQSYQKLLNGLLSRQAEDQRRRGKRDV